MSRSRPLAIAIAAFAVLLAAIVIPVMPHIGHFNYILDDAYIHLAVARNLAETGWFGVRPGEFVLLSSSPLFTLILAMLHRVFGPSELWPLLLSSLGAVFALAVADGWFREQGLSSRRRGVALLLLGTGAMIVPLVLTGLEHTLHLAFVLLFARLLVRAILEPRSSAWRWIFVASLPLVVVRYESLFLIATAVLLLFWHRRFSLAIGVAAAAIAPALAVGWYSVAHGGTHLPTSVLVKGGIPADAGVVWFTKSVGVHFLVNVREAPHIAGMIVAVGVLLAVRRRAGLSLRAPAPLLGMLSLGCMLCFMISSFASGFYRYELWLVWMSGAAMLPMFFEQRDITRKERRHWTLVLWFPAFFAFARALSWTKATPTALLNIHDQQIVLGSLIARYHHNEPIVVNDIGYMTWRATRNVIDFAGLATPRITRAWRRGDFSMQMYDEAARAENARIAILFPNWYPELPARFVPVATFAVPNNVCHNDVFAVYALDAEMARQLASEVASFPVEPPVEKTLF